MQQAAHPVKEFIATRRRGLEEVLQFMVISSV